MQKFFSLFSLLFLVSPLAFAFENAPQPSPWANHIVVSNSFNRGVSLLSPDGQMVRDLFLVDPTSNEAPVGLARFDEDHILVLVKGVSRITKSNLADGDESRFAVHTAMAGELSGIARLPSGNVLVGNGDRILGFASSGVLYSNNAFVSRQLQISSISNAPAQKLLVCSKGSDRVATIWPDWIRAKQQVCSLAGHGCRRLCCV
jgi:hypothetical protein